MWRRRCKRSSWSPTSGSAISRGRQSPPGSFALVEFVVLKKLRLERWRRWVGGDRAEVAELPSLEPSALERIDQAQASELVYRLLDRMSERYRSVLVLSELEGFEWPRDRRAQGSAPRHGLGLSAPGPETISRAPSV